MMGGNDNDHRHNDHCEQQKEHASYSGNASTAMNDRAARTPGCWRLLPMIRERAAGSLILPPLWRVMISILPRNRIRYRG